jgi:hypothetical protein
MKYVNVRRLFAYVEHGANWAVASGVRRPTCWWGKLVADPRPIIRHHRGSNESNYMGSERVPCAASSTAPTTSLAISRIFRFSVLDCRSK